MVEMNEAWISSKQHDMKMKHKSYVRTMLNVQENNGQNTSYKYKAILAMEQLINSVCSVSGISTIQLQCKYGLLVVLWQH